MAGSKLEDIAPTTLADEGTREAYKAASNFLEELQGEAGKEATDGTPNGRSRGDGQKPDPRGDRSKPGAKEGDSIEIPPIHQYF